MPVTQYLTATTLDGFVADEENSLSWLFEVDRDEEGQARSTAFPDGVGGGDGRHDVPVVPRPVTPVHADLVGAAVGRNVWLVGVGSWPGSSTTPVSSTRSTSTSHW